MATQAITLGSYGYVASTQSLNWNVLNSNLPVTLAPWLIDGGSANVRLEGLSISGSDSAPLVNVALSTGGALSSAVLAQPGLLRFNLQPTSAGRQPLVVHGPNHPDHLTRDATGTQYSFAPRNSAEVAAFRRLLRDGTYTEVTLTLEGEDVVEISLPGSLFDGTGTTDVEWDTINSPSLGTTFFQRSDVSLVRLRLYHTGSNAGRIRLYFTPSSASTRFTDRALYAPNLMVLKADGLDDLILHGPGHPGNDSVDLVPYSTGSQRVYNWDPQSSSAVIAFANAVTATSNVTLTFRLSAKPFAHAGRDQTAILTGDTVSLDGGKSLVFDGGNVVYAWTQQAGTGTPFVTGADTETPSVALPASNNADTLRYRLTVRSDAEQAAYAPTDTDDVTLAVLANQSPTADAGADQSVAAGTAVTLDGSGSSDPEGGTLTYQWSQTAGTTVTLADWDTASPSFTAPSGSTAVTLTFRLQVRDPGGLTDTDTVSVSVASANQSPVADAGPDQTVAAGAIVTLNGSGSSDPDGDTLTYQWVGGGLSLTDADTASPTFTAPINNRAVSYSATLTVTDEHGATDSDIVTIVVEANQEPTADAGADQSVAAGTAVTLDGSGSSDPEGQPLMYAWTQTAGTTVTLADAGTASPSFTAPSGSNLVTLTFRLVVTDPQGLTGQDTVNVVVAAANAAPVADAGSDQSVTGGALVTLDGTGSSDPDGGTLTYRWQRTSGPVVTLSSTTVAMPTFTAPIGSTEREVVLTLEVTESGGLTDTDTVTITIAANQAPTANAGADQSVQTGATVTLDGSGSTDPEGNITTYFWSQTQGTTVSLSSNGVGQTVTFTAPASPQTLRFRLQVFDGQSLVDADTVDIVVTQGNRAPTAEAGSDQTVAPGVMVTLSGAGSSDPDNDTITYSWEQTSGPNITLSDTGVVAPTFTAPESSNQQTLVFRLTVTDPSAATDTDTVTITVSASQAPTANAGADQSVASGAAVTLSGSSSSDPEGGTLTYSWTQTSGTTVTLADADTASPSFTAPASNSASTLVFRLTVTDPVGLTATDTVTITVAANQSPVADAGSNQTVASGAAVTLDGSSSSDPEGGALTYSWTQTSGTSVTLTGASTASPSFTAPTTTSTATLVFRVQVTDPLGLSATDTVTITVSAAPQAPTANAGADQSVASGAAVTLDGSGSSDPEGATVTYAWTQTSGTTVTLADADTASPTFTAPASNSASTLVFRLTVSDPGGLTGTDTVTISVAANQAPTANAGANRNVAAGAAVSLSGASSSDPEGGALTYAWTQTGGTTVALTGANTVNLSFTAPSSATAVTLTFRLTVTDPLGLTDTDDVSVSVGGSNQSPVADAGGDQTVAAGAAVTLSGSGSTDPESETLTYAWTQTSGTTVTLDGTSTATASFTAPGPSSDTTLGFRLTVTDPHGASDTDDVTVTVSANQGPVAHAGSDQSVAAGASVTLDGSGSSDPEGGALTYSWTRTAGAVVTLTGATTVSPSFTAPNTNSVSTVTFRLTVTDPHGATDTDTVTVNVAANQAPTADAGASQSVAAGASVTLDGSGSSDPEGGALTYAWSRTSGPTVTLTGETTASPSFTAPVADTESTLVFRLMVTDPLGLTGQATVTITVAASTPTSSAAVQTVVLGVPNVTTGWLVWADLNLVLDDVFVEASPSSILQVELYGSIAPGWVLVYLSPGTANFADLVVGRDDLFTFQAEGFDDLVVPAPDYVGNRQRDASGREYVFQTALSTHSTLNAWCAAIIAASPRPSVSLLLTSGQTVTTPTNQAPTADAGSNQNVAAGARVTLDGSGSSDPDGDALTYEWEQTSGTTVTLSSTSAVGPNFDAPIQDGGATLVFRLTVRDPSGLTGTDTVTVSVAANLSPTADAGDDQAALTDATVTLDGSGSSDPENETLTYAWTHVSGPSVTLAGADTATASFTAPSAAGTIVIRLTVTDPAGATGTDTVTITVSDSNQAPTADAGGDQTVASGAAVTLDGSGSSDPEGVGLTYAWEQTSGTSVTLTGAATASATFTAPVVTTDTDLVFRLTVTDSGTLTDTDSVRITVSANQAPTANAGPDQAVAAGGSVTLDGSGSSDPEGGSLTYSWVRTSGPTITLENADTVSPSFVAPAASAASTVVLRLTVTDDAGNTDSDTVSISVAANQAPTANAGPNQGVASGSRVDLDGSGSSDPEGQPLTYAWTQLSGTSVSLTGADTATPSFAAPTTTTSLTLRFRLTVEDPVGATDTDDVTISVIAANQAPTADAGSDQSVAAGASVTLDGSGSSDPEGGSLTYSWTQTSGESVTLVNASTASPSFTAPALSGVVTLVFRLQVQDSAGLTGQDTVTVTVAAANQAPTADAGADQNLATGSSVTLDGSGSSDPEGGSLTYSWVRLSGPAVTLHGANTATATFTPAASSAVQTWVFRLTVIDSAGASDTDSVTITVSANQAPTANAGADQSVAAGATVTLSGTGTDPEGGALTYTWSRISGPVVTLSGGNTATATFTAPRQNTASTLVFRLRVRDAAGLTATDTVTVTVGANLVPIANAGPDQNVRPSTLVVLDGSGSYDPDGTTVTYRWTQASGFLVTLSSQSAASPTFTAPSRTTAHVMVFGLQVEDADGATATDSVTINVGAGVPSLPAVDDQTAYETRAFSLVLPEGVDGDAPLTYSVLNRPAWLAFDPDTRTLSGTPQLADIGTRTLTYRVRDNTGDTADQTFGLTVLQRSPDSPSLLIATADGATAMELSWENPTNVEVFGSKIEASADLITWTVLEANTMSEATTYRQTGLMRAQRVYYRVSALGADGPSLPSAVASGVTDALPPSPPRNVAGSVTGHQLTLTWAAPLDNGGRAVESYTVRESESFGASWSVLLDNVQGLGTTLANLPDGHVRTYSVLAVNSIGASQPSEPVNVVIVPQAPDAPTNLVAAPRDRRAFLAWTAPPHDGGSDILRYEVSQDSGAWVSTGGTSTTYEVIELTNGESYTFRVRAVNDLGNGAVSNDADVDLPEVPVGVPEDPGGEGLPASVRLTWNPPVDAFVPEFGWEALTPLHDGLLTESPLETNLLAGGHYTIGIKAVDTAGNESLRATLVQSTFGDPRLGNAFLSVFPHFLGWPGDQWRCQVNEANQLVANDNWAWQDQTAPWSQWDSWVSSPYQTIRYDHPAIDIGSVLAFTLTVQGAGHGIVTAMESHSDDGVTYSAYAAVPARMNLTTRYLRIRLSVSVTDGSQPTLNQASIVLTGDSETEILSDVQMATLPGSVGDRRLTLVKNFALITSVQLTLQGVTGIHTPVVVDRDVTAGPRIQVYDASGNLTDVTIDVVVHGAV